MAPVRKKALGNLVQRAIITTDPQEAIAEYLQSKLQDQNIKKEPDWDLARASPAAELVKARRELGLAEYDLAAKAAQQVERRKVMDQQWTELRQKEILLRQSFVKFNKFAKENQEKRERAGHKINDELALQVKREEEIKEVTLKLEHMKKVRDTMMDYVKDYKMYQDYLERVVSETGQFQSISEIFARYECLAEARANLSATQDQHLHALEAAGVEMVRLTEEKAQVLMGLNNKLAHLQGRYDRAKAQALRWETTVSRIKGTAAARSLELTQIRSCCWNVYQQICKRKGLSVDVDKDDVENQLVHIKRTILELKRITRVARKMAAKEEKEPLNPSPGEATRKLSTGP